MQKQRLGRAADAAAILQKGRKVTDKAGLVLLVITFQLQQERIKKYLRFNGGRSAADQMCNIAIFVVCRPLSSRHYLWTPVKQHRHGGTPWGFVLF